MPYFLTLFISLLLLTSCYGKEEIEKYSHKNKTTDWQYRKTSLQEIQKKLINIQNRAMYVRLEKRYYQKGKGTEVIIGQLSQELKNDLLEEWKSACEIHRHRFNSKVEKNNEHGSQRERKMD